MENMFGLERKEGKEVLIVHMVDADSDGGRSGCSIGWCNPKIHQQCGFAGVGVSAVCVASAVPLRVGLVRHGERRVGAIVL